MSTAIEQFPSYKCMTLLSRLLLTQEMDADSSSWMMEELRRDAGKLMRDEFDSLHMLASLNHVVMRAFDVFLELVRQAHDEVRAGWAIEALANEQERICNALPILKDVCDAFASRGLDITVIKSLDHWPDLGSDLDLYTNASSEDVIQLMTRHFEARMEARSWGDRLARKWNFKIPGLPESIEIHVGRLGQTGEQMAIASSLMSRTRLIAVGGQTFRVPSRSDRLMISTLQRMYRHFYFRLCDIVDSAALVEVDGVDFNDLHAAAANAGIWEGVATYLVIVSDYVMKYRGRGLNLPREVIASAHFGGDSVYYGRGFIRVPIMPQSARLYGSQMAELLKKRELNNSARLSLLPALATAAMVGQKITGSDKGIW